MKKPSIKWLALTAVAGISLCISGVHMANASEVLYDDSNVSLTSAVDRYIATNDNPVANIVEGYEEEPKEQSEELVAAIDDKAGTVNDGKVTATIEEVKQPQKATGSVKVNNITGEIKVVDGAEDAAEETTEATTENTTEATTTQTSYDNTSTDGFTYALSEPDFTGRAVVKATGTVNIRESGDISASRVGDIAGGGIVRVEERGSEWTKISSNGITGYMKNDYLLFDSDAASYAAGNLKKVVRINTASLRVRAAANESSETLSIVTEGSPYGIEEIGAGWTKISVDDSTSGYVRNDYIILDYTGPVAHVVTDPVVTTPSTSQPTTESSGTTGITTPPSSNLGQEIANYAQQFVGNPYVYGGTSLTNGADCSGFVMTIYKNYGYSIPRTADVQGTVGTEVALTAVAPGDLIFYDHGTGSIKHVAMYIGNGQVVHASSSTTGIIISNMYYNTPCKAVRIVN